MGVLGGSNDSTSKFGGLIVPSVWAVAYLCTSTLVFGLTFGVVFSLHGVEGAVISPAGTDFLDGLTMAAAVYGYGVFVWTLMTIMTLPVTLLPVVAWVALAKGYAWMEADRKHVLFGTLGMAIITFITREAYLDFPSFWHNPVNALTGRWASASYAISAVVSVWGGLALPRLFMPDLSPGVFGPDQQDQALPLKAGAS